MSIAKDIASEILKHRPIYIVFRQDSAIEYAKAEILGIYYVFDEAKLALLTHAFNTNLSVINENKYMIDRIVKVYDPSQRFYKYSFYDFLHDRWRNTTAVSRYDIQEWSPNNKIPTQTTYFDFDNWFKNMIFNKFFDDESQNQPEEIRKYIVNTLTNWKNEICTDLSIPTDFESPTLWTNTLCEKNNYEGVHHEIWTNRFKDESTDHIVNF